MSTQLKRLSIRGAITGLAVVFCLVEVGIASAAPHKDRGQRPVKAVIVGAAASPVLNAIRDSKGHFDIDKIRMQKGNLGNTGTYQVMIVDGDNISPQRLQGLPEIRRFADSGRWVLALDLRHGRFRRAVQQLTGFGGIGHSRVFMFRRATVDGSPEVQMVSAPQLTPAGASALKSSRQRQLTQNESARLASFVHETVQSDGDNLTESTTESEAAPGEAAIPAELQHVHWDLTLTGSQSSPQGFWSADRHSEKPIFHIPSPGSQTMTWTMTHNFDVYLENGQGKPQGNDEIIAYELNGEFTPKGPSETFFQMFNPFWVGFNTHGPILERAWWTGMIGSSVEPDQPTSEKLIWQASEPKTPNEETEYTSGNEFEVGFTGSKEGAEVEASYKVSNEQTQKIPDWGVENETSGNILHWLFSSRHRCDVRPNHYSDEQCFDVGFSKSGAPNEPSDLSRGQIQVHTSGRWKTKGLLTPGNGQLTFELATPITIADTYCEPWHVGDLGCVRRKKQSQEIGPKASAYSLDAAAVVPIPIDSVTMTPNPVNGAKNQEVTATVKLTRPTAMATNVIIYSDSPNAVVGGPSGRGSQRTISIPKGTSEGSFNIKTNDNGLTPGGHTTASITAFYAEPKVTQLRIEAPAAG